MTDIATAKLKPPTESGARSGAPNERAWLGRHSTLLILTATILLLTASALSRSFYDGRLAAPMTHDDVNYFIEGIQHLAILRTRGFFALISNFFTGFLHAPLLTYQAMLAFLVFGVEDWAPYATNIVYVVVFLGFAAWLVRDCPAIVVAAVMACLIAMPIASHTITEFAPEIVSSLFTAIGVILMVRLPLFNAPLASRFRAGLCFGLAFLAHPVASPFTMIALVATLGLNFLRDIGWPSELKKLQIGTVKSLVNIGLSVWLPALYIVPRYHEYWIYFYDALTNPTWVYETRQYNLDHPLFYLVGNGGRFMFGNKLWAYAGIVCLGIFAAWWHRDWQSLVRQVQLALLTFVFWLVPALAPEKNHLFGLPFGFSVVFMTVIALASIYRSMLPARGAAVVSILGFSLLVFYQPAGFRVPNTPYSVLERELTWRAIDRIKADLVGNAVDPHGIKVYMTNIGAYAPNILQYYLLKTDPTLDWTFRSLAYDSNAQHHIDFIRGSIRDHTSTQDFVIAGERYNGLTYQRQAAPAEETVYASMWQDPNFMALDRFYGPGGREITIFARRGSFAGWRPVSMAEQALLRWERKDDQRYAAGGLINLQTFAARPIEADLEIEWVGEVSGQKLTIVVNQQNVAELTYSTEREISSLRQQIRLSRGTNDIVLKSDAPVRLNHLLIVPYIAGKPPDQGISVATATYGSNCNAPQGNATRDVAESCQGKSDCAYKIQPTRLGDPAQGCGKNFAVSYFCPSESVMRHNKLPAESDGKTVRLSCAPGISVASATYGGNCGAPQGNATYDVASSCYGKVDCQYTVDPNRLGDPAGGCDKDFAVSYLCPSESAMRHNELSGKSDDQTLNLSCDFEISPPRVVEPLSQVGSPPPRTDMVTKVTNISELPPLPEVFLRPEQVGTGGGPRRRGGSGTGSRFRPAHSAAGCGRGQWPPCLGSPLPRANASRICTE